MIKITPNAGWKAFNKIYGKPDLIQRYYWFLFEFGKRSTKHFHKYLGEKISKTIGDSEYKKRLIVAEVRDKGKLAWWAVVAKAQSLTASGLDPNTTAFYVEARFEIDGDPVREILDEMGPWTADTIPFIPSTRSGAVIAKEVGADKVEEIRKFVKKNWSNINSKMVVYGLVFEDRMVVYRKMQVIRDLEVDALRYEFTMGKPHWRPSLRWIRKQGIKKMEKEKDLIRAWIDPKFAKYRVFKHFRIKLTQAEIKRLQSFQEKVRQG